MREFMITYTDNKGKRCAKRISAPFAGEASARLKAELGYNAGIIRLEQL